jgi:2',3'-cyclic-nucleotide 2'-phosphodiesterase (5'-nucleotidase family)
LRTLIVTRFDGSEDVLVGNYTAQGDLDRPFTLATNSFLATGGDGFFAIADGISLSETDVGEQTIFEDYIQDFLGGRTVDTPDPPAAPSRIVILS